MAKGVEAKEYVAKKLKEVFGNDYIGEVDKKYYVWSYEGGQKVQIAIAMTCPKVPVGEVNTEPFDWSDSDSGSVAEPKKTAPIEISDDERDKVADLMKRLGL